MANVKASIMVPAVHAGELVQSEPFPLGAIVVEEGATDATLVGTEEFLGAAAVEEGAPAVVLEGTQEFEGTIAAAAGAETADVVGGQAFTGDTTAQEAPTAATLVGTHQFVGDVAAREASTSVALVGTEEFRGGVAATEAATQALIQGSQEARGVVAAAAAATQCAMVSLMDQMVTDVQNAGFTVYASYDHRKNVRLDTDGVTVNGVDDERDSTSTGQAVFPVAGGILCGDYAGLDGATKATFTFFFVVGSAPSGASTILSRLRNGSVTGQFSIRFNSSTIELVMGNGAALVTQKTASAFATPGTVFKATLTIDLVAAVTHVYTQQYDVSAQTLGAEVDRGMTAYPAFPVAFSTPPVTNLCIGGQVTSSNGGSTTSPLADGSGILRARIRPGVILTAAQRAVDTLFPNESDPNWVPSAKRYEMQGNVNNTGTVPGNDGVLPSTAFLCSDDIRYGATLASGGTNRMSWSAINGFGTNGVNTFARAIGGLLGTLPAATYRILSIGVPPSGVGTWVHTAFGFNTSDNELTIQSPSAGQLQAQWRNTALAALAPGVGTRAMLARIVSTNQVAILDGSGAEVVGAGTTNSFQVPTILTLFANNFASPSNFAPNGTIKKVMILKATTGTVAALQALVDSYGIAFFNASI